MRAVTETEFVGFPAPVLALGSGRLKLDARENGSGAYDGCLESGISELPPVIETEARFRSVSKEAAVGVDMLWEGTPAASRLLENCSRALMRLEIPEDTLIFLATNGAAEVSGGGNVLETDLPVAKVGVLGYWYPVALGFETAREFLHASDAT
jgi:hypothetical protein